MKEELFRRKEMKEELLREINGYINHGLQPSGFLEAVLTNDLAEALYMADDDNAARLKEILFYLNRHCPRAAKGSIAQIKAWVRDNGYAGRRRLSYETQY